MKDRTVCRRDGLVVQRAQYVHRVRSILFWKYVLIMFIVVSLTILYLWEQIQVIDLDSSIRHMKTEIAMVEEENNRLFARVCSLSQGHEIIRRAENDLNMNYPAEEPTVIMTEPYDDDAARGRADGVRSPLTFVSPHDRRTSTF